MWGAFVASYHRAALYVFFDAIETDLKNKIRQICLDTENVLSEDERAKARRRLDDSLYQDENLEDFDLVDRLDLGDKYDIILRWRARLPAQEAKFFLDKNDLFKANISVRNAIMHGRPLTVEEFSKAFSLIDVLKKLGITFLNLLPMCHAVKVIRVTLWTISQIFLNSPKVLEFLIIYPTQITTTLGFSQDLN